MKEIKRRKNTELNGEHQDINDINKKEIDKEKEEVEQDEYYAEESHDLIKTFVKEGSFEDWEKGKDGALRHPHYESVHIDEVGNFFGSYKELTKCLSKNELSGKIDETKVTWEAHHLIEQNILKKLGLDTDEAPCVALTREDHDKISEAKNFSTVTGMKESYKELYEDQPAWIELIDDYIKKNEDHIKVSLELNSNNEVADSSTNASLNN